MGNLNIPSEVLREMENNLVPFRYVVLSNDPDKELPAADFHYRLSDMLLNGKNNVAMEMFRESGKSSYALRTFPLHCLAYPKKGLDFIVIIFYFFYFIKLTWFIFVFQFVINFIKCDFYFFTLD